MDYNAERYECKTPRPDKDDFTMLTFYNRLEKREEVFTKAQAKKLDLKKKPELTQIHEEFNDVDFNKARAARNQAITELEELYVKDLLESEGLPDNKLSRSLVSHARHDHCDEEAWYNMSHYTEIYHEAESFFGRGK